MSELIYYCAYQGDAHGIQKCEAVYRSATGRTDFLADLHGQELLRYILDGGFAWDFRTNALERYTKSPGDDPYSFFNGKRNLSIPVHRLVTFHNANPTSDVVCNAIPFIEEEPAFLESIRLYVLNGGYVIQWFPDGPITIYCLHGKMLIAAWSVYCNDIGVTVREVTSSENIPVW